MPDESEDRVIPRLPGETHAQFLKRISQMPCEEGESRFVRGAGLGPISVVPMPKLTPEQEQAPELTPEANEENFRIYMERRRRIAQGLPPGPVTDEHFRPKQS